MYIAFYAFTPINSFEDQGVKCSYGLKVFAHKNKDLLQTSPALIIYECPASEKLNNLGSNHLIKTIGNKTFVFQILDSAWINFANATIIQ